MGELIRGLSSAVDVSNDVEFRLHWYYLSWLITIPMHSKIPLSSLLTFPWFYQAPPGFVQEMPWSGEWVVGLGLAKQTCHDPLVNSFSCKVEMK